MGHTFIDYDDTSPDGGVRLCNAAAEQAFGVQSQRNDAWERLYMRFHCKHDMTHRNVDRANLKLPKDYAVIMGKSPREVHALFGSRPYIPFDSKNKDENIKEVARLQSDMLDELLYKGGFKQKAALWDMLKMLYGTGYMEAIPFFQDDIVNSIVPQQVMTPMGPQVIGYARQTEAVKRLRLKLQVFAPWEVLVDPYATSLAEPGCCRYVIKLRVVSKRQLKKMIEAGAYKGIDPKQIDDLPDSREDQEKWVGQHILAKRGLDQRDSDQDIGLIMSYESEERYIDVFDGRLELRDRDNPFDKMQGGHGLINLSKMVHNLDPHTDDHYWGNSEIEAVEQLSMLHDDLFNMTMDNANFMLQGKTYHDANIPSEDLVHQAGAKIAIDLLPGERVSDKVEDSFGQSLPSDFYRLQDVVSEYHDIATGHSRPNYGQQLQGQHTATEHMDIAQSGDERQELNVALAETALSDLGHKCLCHIDQFARPEDKVELVGEEGAMMLAMSHPKDLPGGWDFKYRGSDAVMNQALKQQNLTGMYQAGFKDSPFVRRGELESDMLYAFNMGDRVDAIIRSEEEVMQMQMMMAQQQMMDEGGGGGGPSAQDMAGQDAGGMSQQAGQAQIPKMRGVGQ